MVNFETGLMGGQPCHAGVYHKGGYEK